MSCMVCSVHVQFMYFMYALYVGEGGAEWGSGAKRKIAISP